MWETAENSVVSTQIPRQEQDELAMTSHQRAVAAQRTGSSPRNRCGPVRTRQGEELIDTDEHPRADTSVDS